jgi:hypothetical protein
MWHLSKASQSTFHGNKVSLLDLPKLIVEKYSDTSCGPYGKLDFIKPVVQMNETPPFFAIPPSPLGSSPPQWLNEKAN